MDPVDMRQRRRRRLLTILIILLLVAKRNGPAHPKKRYYFTRKSLPPTPRHGTAWLYLYESRDNRAFILTMGVGVHLFEEILESGFDTWWTTMPLPRNDVGLAASSRARTHRSLNSSGALGLALHYLSSTMNDYTLQQVFGITPAVCSRYRNWALILLQKTLATMRSARIQWPTARECETYSTLINNRHPVLSKAIGFVDGYHLPVRASENFEEQNAFYNGWCASHFTSNIFVFAPDGCIIFATINAPGSWHDAQTSRDLYDILLHSTPEGYWIIGDTAFPTGAALKARIRTPPKLNWTGWPSDIDKCRELILFNEALVSARQAAEWGMRSLQGSFGRLKMPMPASNKVFRHRIIQICCRLHNLRARVEGINQIRTVYGTVWTETGDSAFTGFENLRFRDIRRNNRIRRYYNFIP